MANTIFPCNTNGTITDIATSKFRQDYSCSDPNNPSHVEPLPFTIDDDQSLPHLIPEVSDVSAFDYLALKSSVLAVERAIGGPTGLDAAALVNQMQAAGLEFTSLAGVLVHFNTDMFVPLSGNVGHPMSGPLILDSRQKVAWGQNCETYAIFADADTRVSLNSPSVGAAVVAFPKDDSGTPPVVPLAIVGHDATPLISGTRHRRVRIFDDLDVVEDLRAGRDIIGQNGYFDTLSVAGATLSDVFVAKAGDIMSGDLSMQFGSSLRIDNVNGKVLLSAPSSTASPVVEFRDGLGSWLMSSRSGDLTLYKSIDTDTNVVIKNSSALGVANLAVEGLYRGLVGSVFSNSSIDLSQNGQVIIHSAPSSATIYDGPTASAHHYQLSASQANQHFDGSADLVEHLNNVNAHHEEIHDIGSHVVLDSGSRTYRSIDLPSNISKSFGEMLEDLINHGNADAYHTHGGSTVRWGNLQFTDLDSRTIIQYMESNYCRQPCGGGGGGGSSDWDLLPRIAASDPTRIQEFILGKTVSTGPTRLLGAAGFITTTGSVYGYKPYWATLELSGTDATNIGSYIAGTAGHLKGEIGAVADGYGYMPYWGALKQTAGGPTIQDWLNANICSIVAAQGCGVGGGGGGGVVRWSILGKSDAEPGVLIDQFMLGTANSGTAIGYIVDGTHYGYSPYWSALRQDGPAGTTLIDYLNSLDSNLRTWATSTFCAQSGGCGGGPGGTVYWDPLARSVSDGTTIAQYIGGIAPGVTGEFGASPTFGYKPYWDTLKKTSNDPTSVTSWVLGNVYWSDRKMSSSDTTTVAQYIAGKNTPVGEVGASPNWGYQPYWGALKLSSGSAQTIQQWVAANFCPQSGGCGGGGVAGVTDGTNIGSGQYAPFINTQSGIMRFQTLTAGSNVTISNNTISVSIPASSGVTITNQGTGIPVYGGVAGAPTTTPNFKTIAASSAAGSTVTVSESNGTILIGNTAAVQKFPLIFPFEVDKSCANGSCAISGGGTGQSKSTAMTFFQSTYGITDLNVANYNWYIVGSVFTINNTSSASNIRNFKADVRISATGDFVIDWNFLAADSVPYNIKWSGFAMAVHV